MNERNKGILIAILLGWCGGYRFYKKQVALGLLYLVTFGLFGIGWLVDIILSIKPTALVSISPPAILVNSFYTKVVGVTYPCTQGGCVSRQEALGSTRRKDTLSIEQFEYEGKPAFRVVLDRNHSDIGNLSAELARELSIKYVDCTFKISEYEVTGGNGNNYGCNIKLEIYK